jgi:hypothetical protein
MDYKIEKYLHKNNDLDLPRDYNLLKLLYNFKKQNGGAAIPSGTDSYISFYHGHLVSSPPMKLPVGMYLLLPICCGFPLLKREEFKIENLNSQLSLNKLDRTVTFLQQKFILLKPGEYYCDVGLDQNDDKRPVMIPRITKIKDGDNLEGDFSIDALFDELVPYALFLKLKNTDDDLIYDEILNLRTDTNWLLKETIGKINLAKIKFIFDEVDKIIKSNDIVKYHLIKDTNTFFILFNTLNNLITNIPEPNFKDIITDYLSIFDIDYTNKKIDFFKRPDINKKINQCLMGQPNTEEINTVNKQKLLDFLNTIDSRYTIGYFDSEYTPSGIAYQIEPLLQKLFTLDYYVNESLKLSDLIERISKKEPGRNKLVISISCQSTPDFCQSNKCLSLYKPKRDILFWEDYDNKFLAFKSAVGLDFSDSDIFFQPIVIQNIFDDVSTDKVEYTYKGKNKYIIYLRILQLVTKKDKIYSRKILVLLKKFNPGYIYNLFNIIIGEDLSFDNSPQAFDEFNSSLLTLLWFLSLDYIKSTKEFPEDILINTIHPRIKADIENAIQNPQILKLYKDLVLAYADFHTVLI